MTAETDRPTKVTVILWYGEQGQVIDLEDYDLNIRHRIGFHGSSNIEVSGDTHRITEGRTYVKVVERDGV